MQVSMTADAREALDAAHSYFDTEPVTSNLVATLLTQRAARPEPGRFWLAEDGGAVCGVAFQSPLDFHATLTSTPGAAAAAIVDHLVDNELHVPGIHGPAASAAAFAGHWTERVGAAARPVLGMRLYELTTLAEPAGVEGELRSATADDLDLAVEWSLAFSRETGEPVPGDDRRALVEAMIEAGQLLLWVVGGRPVSMVGRRDPVHGRIRIGPVYTPPADRGRGFAAAATAAVAASAVAEGHGVLLFTDLGNPVSNRIYRRLGFVAVEEFLRYDLG